MIEYSCTLNNSRCLGICKTAMSLGCANKDDCPHSDDGKKIEYWGDDIYRWSAFPEILEAILIEEDEHCKKYRVPPSLFNLKELTASDVVNLCRVGNNGKTPLEQIRWNAEFQPKEVSIMSLRSILLKNGLSISEEESLIREVFEEEFPEVKSGLVDRRFAKWYYEVDNIDDKEYYFSLMKKFHDSKLYNLCKRHGGLKFILVLNDNNIKLLTNRYSLTLKDISILCDIDPMLVEGKINIHPLLKIYFTKEDLLSKGISKTIKEGQV